jgi:hypothetical protein
VVLGLSAWILVGRGFNRLPDGGMGLCVLIGVLGAAGAAWISSFLRVMPLTRAGGVSVISLAVVLAVLKVILRRQTQQRILPALRSHGLGALAAVCIGAFVVIVMRSSDATLLGASENNVEAAYLTYLMRNEDSRPIDLFQPDQRLPIIFVDRFALGWLLKSVGIPGEAALNASFVVLGAIFAGVLYSALLTMVGRSRPALVGVLILIIPLVYGLHITRDVTNKPIAARLAQDITAGNRELARWVRSEVSATPALVQACDQGEPVNVAISVGLPSFTEAGPAEGGLLCSLEDPEQVYRRMMELRLELFVTPSAQSAASPTARSRYEKFSSRPDLFALVFDDDHLALFVPSFSRYYPRAVPS